MSIPWVSRKHISGRSNDEKQFEKDFEKVKDFNEYLKDEAEKAPHGEFLGVLPCETQENGYWPKTDLSVWLRSCISEVEKPLEGKVTGRIPRWICGNLLQNGPGKFYFGDKDVFNHLFDGSALIQKYDIRDGKVSYTCRFLRTESFMKNINAGKILTSEFGTNASHQIENQSKYIPGFINRMTKMRGLDHIMSDNAMISVYPFGNEHYCFYESPFIQRLDVETLKVIERVDLNKAMGVISAASHPHFEDDGSMLSVGMTVGALGPRYVINKIPVDPCEGEEELENKRLTMELGMELGAPRCFTKVVQVANVPSRWMLDPGYMHSFSITENYYIIIEQPLTINLPKLVKSLVSADGAIIDGMFWHGESPTLFHIVPKDKSKIWGGERFTFQCDAFFFLHTINAYEKDDHIVIDISCYRNCSMLYLMSVEKLSTAQSNKEYSKKFQGRPHRFVIPMSFDTLPQFTPSIGRERKNLVTLSSPTLTFGAVAQLVSEYKIHLTPGKICNVGCETPTINYDEYNGKPYRYFYGICADVDDPDCSGKIYKVDVTTGKVIHWMQDNVYCAEAQFVPRPKRYASECLEEDDGVIISSLIKGNPDVHFTGLLVLNAKTMKEIGRAEFVLDGPAPKPLHGCFSKHKGIGLSGQDFQPRNKEFMSLNTAKTSSTESSSSSGCSTSSMFELGSSDLFTTPYSSTASSSSGQSDERSSNESSNSEIFTAARRQSIFFDLPPR